MKFPLLKRIICCALSFFTFSSFYLFNSSEPNRKTYEQADAALKKWGQQAASRFGLTFIGQGGSSVFGDDDEYKHFRNCYAVSFFSRSLINQEQGPTFVLPLLKLLWSELNQNPAHNKQQALLSQNAAKNNRERPSRITPNMIGIKITFWDCNTERPLKPYLAQIRVFNNKIQYFYTDPVTKRLARPPVEEPLEPYFNPNISQ